MNIKELFEILGRTTISSSIDPANGDIILRISERENVELEKPNVDNIAFIDKPTSFKAKKSRTIDKVQKDEEKRNAEFQKKFAKAMEFYELKKFRIAQAAFEAIIPMAGSKGSMLKLNSLIMSCRIGWGDDSVPESALANREKERAGTKIVEAQNLMASYPLTEEEAFKVEKNVSFQQPELKKFNEEDLGTYGMDKEKFSGTVPKSESVNESDFPSFDEGWPE